MKHLKKRIMVLDTLHTLLLINIDHKDITVYQTEQDETTSKCATYLELIVPFYSSRPKQVKFMYIHVSSV